MENIHTLLTQITQDSTDIEAYEKDFMLNVLHRLNPDNAHLYPSVVIDFTSCEICTNKLEADGSCKFCNEDPSGVYNIVLD